jgi:hypothetical protein
MTITKKLRIDLQDVEGQISQLQDELDALSSTELGFLDGATEGTVVASKAVVAGSAGQTPMVSGRVDDGAAVVLTPAMSGSTCFCDLTTGFKFTLPVPTVGLVYTFVWPASYASGTQRIETNAGGVLIAGTILKFDTDTLTDPLSVETYATDKIAVVIDAVADGGLLGSWLVFTAVSTTLWHIRGILHHSGNVSGTASAS